MIGRRWARPTGRESGLRRLTSLVAVALTAIACTGEPAPAPTPTPTSTPTAVTDDADAEVLAARVAELRATVAALGEALEAAAAGDEDALGTAGLLLAADLEAASDPAVARAAADAATDPEDTVTEPGPSPADDEPAVTEPTDGTSTAEQTDDAPSASDPPPLAPLLPGPVTSRATTVSYGDLLTSALAAARGAGGQGEPVARFLSVPLAGDLGAWQRSPADLLALIAEAGTQPDVDAAADAILALDGEAPRALAWVVHGLTTSTPAADAAARASAHVAVIELSLLELS